MDVVHANTRTLMHALTHAEIVQASASSHTYTFGRILHLPIH